ncbi:ABC transporter substrate-binding protein [Thermocoleostomius sinensis]|uniref:ABC transporter substrate-binding protein n=1 Tax=Thermocoleostomius sinensis A174 TaxID=2016057 RepID=A0A9E8ZC02_9CYAN|nr:ABC transporter substrate-binding protein [Thermocoleostomius sinensis]WAL60358.1 ABC transporter substrate-binding protein [Thermocoleostomius sinensis A174]
MGSWLQELAHYLWTEPTGNRIEPGLMNVSLDRILQGNRDIIFVQTYPPSGAPLSQQLAKHPLWKQLKAMQTHQVYEVEQFWHSGNGTRMIRLMLNQLLSVIYPQLFPQPSSKLNEH